MPAQNPFLFLALEAQFSSGKSIPLLFLVCEDPSLPGSKSWPIRVSHTPGHRDWVVNVQIKPLRNGIDILGVGEGDTPLSVNRTHFIPLF